MAQSNLDVDAIIEQIASILNTLFINDAESIEDKLIGIKCNIADTVSQMTNNTKDKYELMAYIEYQSYESDPPTLLVEARRLIMERYNVLVSQKKNSVIHNQYVIDSDQQVSKKEIIDTYTLSYDMDKKNAILFNSELFSKSEYKNGMYIL